MRLDFLYPQEMAEIQNENMSFAQEYQSLLYMMLVPVYALVSKIVFLNKKIYNYTEHMVINMYLSAHFAIVSAIVILLASFMGINYAVSWLAIMFVQTLYSAYAFKRLYNLTIGNIVLKYLLFMIIFIIIFVSFALLSTAVMFLNGDFQEALESGKAVSGN